MIDHEINEFVRLIGSISLEQSRKDRITDFLLKSGSERKEIPRKYVAVASAVAFLAIGTYLFTRGTKQDINIM